MISWDRVRELRGEIGGAGFDDVVRLFLEEVDSGLHDLAMAESAPEQEVRLHFLKGCAWNLGFSDFGALCHDLERAARQDRLAPGRIRDLAACYDDSRGQFLAGIADSAGDAA